MANEMRDRLRGLLLECGVNINTTSIADHLIENGVIVHPCKVHDTVYYLNTTYHMALKKNTIYEAKVVRVVTTYLGTCLVIQIRDDEGGCCEIPDIRDWGKTVFLTKEQAEQKLKESGDNGKVY